MAKRRILKKEISYVAGELFTECAGLQIVYTRSKSRESGCFDGSYPRYAR